MKKLIACAAIALSLAAIPAAAAAQERGTWVLAQWRGSTQYFPGVVTARNGANVTIRFDDGDTATVPASAVRLFDWQAGSHVTCLFTDGSWYDATIVKLNEDGLTVDIRYDADGVNQRTNTGRCRTRD